MKLQLSDLATLSFQEIFDIVCEHLMFQCEKSYDSSINLCRYRFDSGEKVLKCAVGPFISDEEYSLDMEGKGAEDLCEKFSTVRIDRDTQSFLVSLQSIHDNCVPESWASRLHSLARNHNIILKSPFLEEIV